MCYMQHTATLRPSTMPNRATQPGEQCLVLADGACADRQTPGAGLSQAASPKVATTGGGPFHQVTTGQPENRLQRQMGQIPLMGVPERPKVVDNRHPVDQLPTADPQWGILTYQHQRTGLRKHVEPQQRMAIGHHQCQPSEPMAP